MCVEHNPCKNINNSMVSYKTAMSQLLTHWRYCSLALSHRIMCEMCTLNIVYTRISYLKDVMSWAIQIVESSADLILSAQDVYMITSSKGTFSALLALCEGNSPVTGKFPSQTPVTRCFYVSFEMRLNKRLSKPSRRRWFETPSRS